MQLISPAADDTVVTSVQGTDGDRFVVLIAMMTTISLSALVLLRVADEVDAVPLPHVPVDGAALVRHGKVADLAAVDVADDRLGLGPPLPRAGQPGALAQVRVHRSLVPEGVPARLAAEAAPVEQI